MKGEDITKNISYILQFFDSGRFIASSLSTLVNNVSEGIPKIKCKYVHDDKKCKTFRIKYKYWNCFLEYINFKGDLIEKKCLYCYKNYQLKFEEELKERPFDINFLSTAIINLIFFLLQKGVYPYEYMDDFEKFNETSFSEK